MSIFEKSLTIEAKTRQIKPKPKKFFQTQNHGAGL